MFELTEEQHNEIAASGDQPVTAIDRQTQTVYLLVRKEIYDLNPATWDEDDARHYHALFANLDPEDWEDASNYHDAK